MIIEDEKEYYTIGEAGKQIDRTARTIKNWYEWAEHTDNMDKLPKMYTKLDERGTRYFTDSGIKQLELFKNSIQRGEMAEISRKKWGKRGRHLKRVK